MWVVVKTGVYIQDVFGPFVTEDEARNAAQTMALRDADDYHNWVVQNLSVSDGLVSTDYSYRGLGRHDVREATAYDESLNKQRRPK